VTRAHHQSGDCPCQLCGRLTTPPLFHPPLSDERLREIGLAYVLRTSGRLRLMGDPLTEGGRVTG
jgi:hypothetical protein